MPLGQQKLKAWMGEQHEEVAKRDITAANQKRIEGARLEGEGDKEGAKKANEEARKLQSNADSAAAKAEKKKARKKKKKKKADAPKGAAPTKAEEPKGAKASKGVLKTGPGGGQYYESASGAKTYTDRI